MNEYRKKKLLILATLLGGFLIIGFLYDLLFGTRVVFFGETVAEPGLQSFTFMFLWTGPILILLLLASALVGFIIKRVKRKKSGQEEAHPTTRSISLSRIAVGIAIGIGAVYVFFLFLIEAI